MWVLSFQSSEVGANIKIYGISRHYFYLYVSQQDADSCIQVGSRPVWKDKQHPFRTDPNHQLEGIPTLIHWTADGKGAQMASELQEADTPEAADALIAEFIARNGL